MGHEPHPGEDRYGVRVCGIVPRVERLIHGRFQVGSGFGLLALVAVCWVHPAGVGATEPDVVLRPADELPVRVLQPECGAVLEAGRSAVLIWRPLRSLEAEGIHEWEAFLSLDGGRNWTARVTPHLEADISSFRFTVPPVPSDDVRLMLRFGDERQEVGYVLPMRLRTVTAPGPAPRVPAPALRLGEPARNGDPGVTLWLDGDREGRRLVLRSAAPAWSEMAASQMVPFVCRVDWFLPERRLVAGASPGPAAFSDVVRRSGRRRHDQWPRPVESPCLISCRQNE